MGLYPLDCPVDVIIAVWEWGAYLGDEGKQRGVRAKVSSLAPDPVRRADPDRQGRRPVPQLGAGQDRGRQGRLRGGDPARRARLRLRGHGREPLHRQGRRDRPRPASPTTSSAASTGPGGRSRSLRDQGYEVVERDIARGELYRADEIFMTGTAAELTPIREVDDLAGRRRRARPDHPRDPGDLRGRAARALGALRRLAGQGARSRSRVMSPIVVYDTTLRDGMQGEGMSLSVEEKVRVAQHPRRARRADDRGGLPDLEPEGARAVRAARDGGAATPTCARSG